MKRRRLVALVSACVLLALGLVAVLTGLVATRTDFGRNQIRNLVQDQLARGIRGKVYLGKIGGGFLSGVTIDSLAIRDVDDDSLFVSTGRITVSYDPRDVIDKRIWIRRIDVEHPSVYLRQHESGRWNFKEIFKSYEPQKKGPRTPGRGFGDYVVIDSAHVTRGRLVLQMPWHPDDTLHGARLDSAIRYSLGRPDKEIRRIVDEGKPSFTRSWRWTNADAFASHMRIADPDSDKLGKLFKLDSLDVDENDPPFQFRHVAAATVRSQGDSIWLNIPHFDLPASTGHAVGKIWWGNDLPVRYDIAIHGDSVALSDVAWVYPTLPRTGGGTMDLQIHNEKDLRVIDYKLTNMDVRSTGSRLKGDMTFGVGAPVLIVKDVRLDASPVDFDLVRTLNGKPFPVDWRGQLYGAVRGRGGPLDHFVVDEAQATWRDSHVRGAVSSFGGKGELDILEPAVTAFHGFSADVQSLDLRSIEYLFPNFPRLGGTVAGRATLDSSWLDLRFANADMVHQDGPGDPSHVTGSGRVTWGAQYITYDLDLDAEPLSLSMLARSYPKLPLQGLVSGPIRATGTIANLQLNAALHGAAGALSFDGLVDIDTPTVVARGSGQYTGLDARRLLAMPNAVPTSLNGRYEMDVAGDSLSNLQGSALVQLDRSELDSVRVFPSLARVHFADGRMRVDTLRLETAAATLTASGGIGLPHGPADSLRFGVSVDSLGGLRRYLGGGTAAVADGRAAATDSLSGTLALGGVAKGRVDSLDLSGWVTGSNVYVRKDRGRTIAGHFDLRDALANPTGTISLRLDTLRLAGMDVDTIGGTLRVANRSAAVFDVGVLSHTGPTLVANGTVRRAGGDSVVVGMSALAAQIDKSAWQLAAPAHLTMDSLGTWLDSFVLTSDDGSRIAASGSAPVTGPVHVELHADSVALADLGVLAQLPTALEGRAALDATVTGTRAAPEIAVRSGVTNLGVGAMHVERVTSTGTYRAERFDVGFDLLRGGVPALTATASLPVDLSSFHFRLPNDSLHGAIRADSADFAIVGAFSPALEKGSGRLTANLDLGGTWRRPTLGGAVRVTDGDLTLPNLGIRLRGIQADVAVIPGRDSLVIHRLTAWSGAKPWNDISLSGFASFVNRDDPLLGLRLDAHDFHALDKKALARLDLSTGTGGLQLVGRTSAAVLKGTVKVDRGVLFLPDRDIAEKQIVDLSGREVFAVIDTTDFRSRSLLPDAPPALVENLRLDDVHIQLGDDVWLRSREANIKLGGALNVTRAPDDTRFARSTFGRRRGDETTYRLALEGMLSADRGTYTLDLLALQREFQVQKGTITFTGAADNNPTIDISALYNVKRPKQRDLGVIVRVHGPFLPNPVIDFSSTENYEISQTDLVSYLLTGLPSFQIQENVSKTAAQLLLPTASTVLARSLRTQLGSWVNLVQFGAADPTAQSTSSTQAASDAAKEFLFGARLGGQTQVTNNLFFSFSAGICPLTNLAPDQPGFGAFVDALGGKLEYRVNPDLSLTAGREPSSRLLYCGSSPASMRSLVPTPPQWGLSLLRTWHF